VFANRNSRMKKVIAFGLRWQSAAATALLHDNQGGWPDPKRRRAPLAAAVHNLSLPYPILKHATRIALFCFTFSQKLFGLGRFRVNSM
jgi:hypothetical protein